MKVIKAAAVPPRKKAGQYRSKYRDAVNVFVRSGFECAEVVPEEGDYGLMAGGLLMMQASLYLFVSASELFDRQEFLSEVDQIERGTR